ncbi:MAG: outer membrane beta-barrel protein [Chthoniobacterales bacterium]
MSYYAVRRIGIFCVVLFGVVGGSNSRIYAQDAANTYSALAPGDSAPPLPAEESGGNATPLSAEETVDPNGTISADSSTAFTVPDGPGVNAVADPEPLTPAEGIALRLPTDSPIPSIEIGAGDPGSRRVFHYGISLGLRGVYDDNINLTRTNKVSGYYFAIEPAIAVGLGDVLTRQGNYIRLDYAPSILFFADDSSRDAVQHVIRLESQYRMSRLTLQLTQDVQLLKETNTSSTVGPGNISNTVNLDVAGRVQVNVYRTHLGGAYDLTGKTFLSGALEYSIYDYGSLISSERFIADLFINYRFSPKLVIGVGGSGGFTWVDSPNPDQTFEQINVRTTYQATGKISLYASGGVEFRQFDNNNNNNIFDSLDNIGDNSSRGTYVTPVYELGATYQPFDGTTFTLRGNRRVQPSAALAGQDFVLSNIIIGVRQRLFQRVYIGVTGGYEHANYVSTISGVTANRVDNYYTIEPSVDFQLTKYCSFGAYYIHRQNDSSSNSFGFSDNQVGVRTKITF